MWLDGQPVSAGALVAQGDALKLDLPDESVDLIITSPPYFALRSYRDGDEHYDGQIGSEPTPQDFLEALWTATAEMKRVLKPSGSIWVNLGDKYAGSGGHNNAGISAKSTLSGNGHKGGVAKDGSENKVKATLRSAPDRYNQNSGGVQAKSLMCLPWRYAIGAVDQLGLILRAEVIWDKPNGLPESVNDRVRRSHEQWFHFTKQGKYFAAVDEVRQTYEGDRALSRRVKHPGEGKHDQRAAWDTPNPLGSLPGSVWTIPSEPLLIPEAVRKQYDLPDHFAAFPQEWPRRIILGWSPSGICVECGEGRRPVVSKEYLPPKRQNYNNNEGHRIQAAGTSSGHRQQSHSAGGEGMNVAATITGYACLCHCTHCVSPNCPTEYHDDTWKAPPTRPSVILDPFGGTGTVAGVARALGRFGISVDLSSDYCRLAEWRIFKSGHFMKTIDRTRGERLLSLFDEAAE